MRFTFYSLFITWLTIVSNNVLGQHLSIGTSHVGIGFGSFTKYYGIDFSLKNKSNQINGFGLTLLGSSTSKVNGFNIGIIQLASKVNGASIGFLFNQTKQVTGLSIGLITSSDTTNGISIGGLFNVSQKQRGLSISGFVNSSEKSTGVSVAPTNICASGGGLQVGIYNCVNHKNFKLPKSHQYIGVQIGLINKIETNRKPFRVLPFINFNFRKLPPVLTPEPIEKQYADSLIAIHSSTMADPRDGKIYKTIEIGNQTWMAQNLAYAPTIDLLYSPQHYTHNGIYMPTGKDYVHYSRKNPPKAFCYSDNPVLCEWYGVLYKWESSQNVCPAGWHLPTESEFDTLLTVAARGGDIQYAYEALLLKGSSGFKALLAGKLELGQHYYFYKHFDESAGFWSSTGNKIWGNAKILSIGKNYSQITKEPIYNGYYVRCIKD
jgi:uncharacterized protein (TIGR02145 family)